MNYIKYILSLIIFGTIGIFVKQVSLPSSQIVLYRTVIASIFFILVFLLIQKKVPLSAIKSNFLFLTLSGIALGINWVFLFEAYAHTSVSIATLLYYFAPTLIIIFSPILFKESYTKIKLLCILFSTLGMILVANIDIANLSANMGIIYGLLSAFGYTLILVFNRKLKNMDDAYSTFFQILIAALVMMVYIFVIKKDTLVIPKGDDLIIILILGVVHTGIACLLYFSSINKLKTDNVAFISYLDPITALLLSYFLLNENLSFIQMLGGAMIIFSSLIGQLKQKTKARKN